jgi:hypothetical protein
MKTTFDFPDQLLRKAKATAANRRQSLKQFVTEALREKLAHRRARADEPEWMRGFGGLKHLHKETLRVQSVIDREFRVVESGGRR